jgi:hypothetical protein
MDQTNNNAPSTVAASVPPAGERLWTPAETATYLSITKSKLERMRMSGDGPDFYKLGRKTVRYAPSILHVWLALQQCRSTAT